MILKNLFWEVCPKYVFITYILSNVFCLKKEKSLNEMKYLHK